MESEKKQRKYYSPEFKAEAVVLCKKIGLTKACEQLGVSSAALSRWKRKQPETSLSGSHSKPSYEELEKEVRRLKKELGYVEEINRVLKKSTAIFSSSQMGGLK